MKYLYAWLTPYVLAVSGFEWISLSHSGISPGKDFSDFS